jgi:hypothetical protein
MGGGGRRNFLNGKDQKERGLVYSKEDHWISLEKLIVKRKFDICGRRDESDERVGIYFDWLTQRGLNTKMPTIAFFLGTTKPLPSYDYARPHRRYSVSYE